MYCTIVGIVYTRNSHKGVWFEKLQGFHQSSYFNPLKKMTIEIANKFPKHAKILSAPHITDTDSDLIINFLRIVYSSLSDSRK